MIAPRHPERFAEVADLLRTAGLHWTSRTAAPDVGDSQTEAILLDSIGELHAVYSLASIVFVGGSIAKTGGHNILEPAAVGVPVIVGPYTFNFQSIVETFVSAGAIVQLQPISDSATIVEMANLITELLADPTRRYELGVRARNLVDENRGATARTIESLSSILTGPTTAAESVALAANGNPKA
jgi:3-deoxy-D-manno-octulosonic-acid transferase